jgi:hypothetical protein
MFSKQSMKRNLTLDIVIANVVLFIGIVFLVLSFGLKYYNGLPILCAISVGSLLYLLLRNRLPTGVELPELRLGNQIRSLSHIIFIISLSLSIWLLWSNLYYRPPTYFILCLVAAASIVLDVFALSETKRLGTYVVLFKIIALSLSIYAGIHYQFPGIYGITSGFKKRSILGILLEASLSAMTISYFRYFTCLVL